MITQIKCKTCNGEGYESHFENQSPLGSGLVWNEEITEECPDCLEKGVCCNCSIQWPNEIFQQYTDWISFEKDKQFECPTCGHSY